MSIEHEAMLTIGWRVEQDDIPDYEERWDADWPELEGLAEKVSELLGRAVWQSELCEEENSWCGDTQIVGVPMYDRELPIVRKEGDERMSRRKRYPKGWKHPYVQSMALCRYIDQGDCKPEYVTEYWHRVFCCVAKYLGFNRATRRILWEGLVVGNWSRLHLSHEEELDPSDDWLQRLHWDVFYCSDRWSLDRLTRCHWLYRTYMRTAMKEVDDG